MQQGGWISRTDSVVPALSFPLPGEGMAGTWLWAVGEAGGIQQGPLCVSFMPAQHCLCCGMSRDEARPPARPSAPDDARNTCTCTSAPEPTWRPLCARPSPTPLAGVPTPASMPIKYGLLLPTTALLCMSILGARGREVLRSWDKDLRGGESQDPLMPELGTQHRLAL